MKSTFRYTAEVLRILDGDTIEVSLDLGFYLRSRLVLRLAGVNTMELRDKDQDKRVNDRTTNRHHHCRLLHLPGLGGRSVVRD